MVVQGLWFDRDSSLWMMRCMNVELADSISKRGIFSVQQLLYLPKATLQAMIGKFLASKLYQDLHPFPRILLKLKLERKVSLFRHHTGEHQFQARKWNTSTWELYALIRAYLSLITWLFTWSYHQLWTRKWKAAEDKARATLFGYYGLNFAVYTFPPIALAIIGSFYLNLKPRESIRSRKGRKFTAGFSNPLVVNTLLGVLSTLETLAIFLFILYLAWNFYARISNDFKNLKPAKLLMLNSWQLKCLKVETRFGLLAEVCLAFLLFPILKGLALFRLLGIQFEASIWEWQKTGRIYLAGEICLVTGLVIWITSLPQIRRKQFEIFYYTHHLYMVFLVFFLFHAGDRHFYMVFPGIFLFGLDNLLLIIQSRPETCILSAQIFPSKAIELILPKDPGPKYTPTSIIFVKVPSISKYQWHSLSITSSSRVDDNTISIMIKSEGSWTSSLSHMIQTRQESDGDQTKYIPIAVEGPCGPVTMDFLRYDSLLLVSGGIGITPVLSIIQELASSQNSGLNKFLPRMQLIYVVKKSQDICLLNSISPLIFGQPAEKCLLKVKVFVTQEEQSDATVRELVNEFSQVQTVNFGTKFLNFSISELENSLWMAAIAGISSILFLIFLIMVNHIIVPSQKNPTKEKTPSWHLCSPCYKMEKAKETDCSYPPKIKQSFRKKGQHKQVMLLRNMKSILEAGVTLKFPDETGASDIGVMVYGPETMKESV
ncbi:unnamed protein product [Prunus armeniaca]